MSQITRIQNEHRRTCFNSFLKHKLKHRNTRLAFHGTMHKARERIAIEGFSEKYMQRFKFGKGINSTNAAAHAIFYSEETKEDRSIHFHVFVCELAKGESATGAEQQDNFGFTADGQEIFNLTAPPHVGPIDVCKYPEQLYPKYDVRLSLDIDENMTPNQVFLIYA